MTFRAAGIGPAGEVRFAAPKVAGDPAPVGERTVEGSPAPVFDRAALGAGATIAGPAIVAELDSTTWLDERSRARVHDSGALLIEVGE